MRHTHDTASSRKVGRQKPRYYVVSRARSAESVGIYTNWLECSKEILHVAGASHHGVSSIEKAVEDLHLAGVTKPVVFQKGKAISVEQYRKNNERESHSSGAQEVEEDSSPNAEPDMNDHDDELPQGLPLEEEGKSKPGNGLGSEDQQQIEQRGSTPVSTPPGSHDQECITTQENVHTTHGDDPPKKVDDPPKKEALEVNISTQDGRINPKATEKNLLLGVSLKSLTRGSGKGKSKPKLSKVHQKPGRSKQESGTQVAVNSCRNELNVLENTVELIQTRQDTQESTFNEKHFFQCQRPKHNSKLTNPALALSQMKTEISTMMDNRMSNIMEKLS